MPRSVPEWIGKTPEAMPSETVKLRLLDRQCPEPGALPICPECGKEIVPGRDAVDYDHRVPLIDGGPNVESNIKAVHRRCHRLRTARQAMERAEVRAKRKKAYGITKSKHPLRSGNSFRRAPSNTRELYGDVEK